MLMLLRCFRLAKFVLDVRGQDLVEYALMAGFVATAAAALFPGITTYLVHIYCNVEFSFFEAGGADAEPGSCEAWNY